MNHAQLINLLHAREIDVRYYALCARQAETYNRFATRINPAPHISRFFAPTTHVKEEYVWHYELPVGEYRLLLSISPDFSMELFIAVYRGDSLLSGGPVHELMHEVEALREPEAQRDPPYPKPLFSSLRELEECLFFAQDLLRTIYLALGGDPDDLRDAADEGDEAANDS